VAQYRCSVQKAVSRGKGQSAVAKAAYNARESLRDERTGELKDYSRSHHNVLFSGIFVDPKIGAPEWVQDRAKLWNEASAAETKKNAREAQEIIVNLPHDLTPEQQEFMLKDFVREQITRGTGRIADVNIHRAPKDGDDRNIHAHILMTVREIGPQGFGEKLPEVDTKQIDRWKEKWAERGAKELRKAGLDLEADRWAVGHRNKAFQREDAVRRGDQEHIEWCDREATKHLGPQVAAMERKGIETDRGAEYRATIEANKLQAELRAELQTVRLEIAGYERGTLPAATQEHTSQQPTPAPKLGRTAAKIHAAYAAAKMPGRTLTDTLEDRGLILSETTAADAERLNKWEAQRLRELAAAPTVPQAPQQKREAERQLNPGQQQEQERELKDYKKYRAGELVVINQHGDIYKLTRSNTGDDAKERAEHLKDIDRAPLLSITAAQAAMQQFRQEQREETEATRQHYYRPEEPPKELTGTAAKILLAHYRSDNAQSFVAALAEKGIAVAITTEEDAERSQSAAAAAFTKGSYAPVYREGEIVAINDRATVYRLNESTTGSKFADMQRYLRTLDTSELRSIEATKQMMYDRAAERGGRGLSNTSGLGVHEQEILDRAERRTKENERAAATREGVQHRTVLDREARRTMENERAQGPRNTRDS
jgi:hypothetical protein